MDFSILLTLIALGAFVLKSRDQGRRIALLGSYLGRHNLEKLMEALTQGYLRALGEADPARQVQIWHLLETTELELSAQFNRFVTEFASVDKTQTQVSKLAIGIPYADKLFPAATFDLRKAFSIHAKGIADAANNSLQLAPKDKAFIMLAELFLMQHSCHWFCRSKTRASARLLARHKTLYAQVLASVSAGTRQAYVALVAK